MKKTILSLHGVTALSKDEQKKTLGGKLGPDRLKCYLPFGLPQTNMSCFLMCGTGYYNTGFNLCEHHN